MVLVVKPVTVRVTLVVSVPVAVLMEMVPVHVVPPASPDGLTETVKFVPVVTGGEVAAR